MIIYAGLSFHHFEKHKLISLSLFFVCGGLAWLDIYPPQLTFIHKFLGMAWLSLVHSVVCRSIGFGSQEVQTQISRISW